MSSITPKFPHMLHGGDYNPDQWLDRPDILEKDIELMKAAHINCASVAIFAWAKLEPEEGRYEFDWLEKVIDNLYKNGIYTVLATPSGAKPRWMSEKYPEIRRVSKEGVRDLSGERHNHCYSSPIYQEKVKAMDKALAERFTKHPGVILWHLSNEYGGICYCDKCQAAFREWLKKKYGTIEALNKQYWTDFWSQTYNSFDEVQAPAPNGSRSIHGLFLDWMRFTTDQVGDFIRMERDTVKAVDPSIPVTTNLMYDFICYNYFKWKDILDVVSWDAYPRWTADAAHNVHEAQDFALWHDVMRSLKQKPFLLMESCPSTLNWQPTSRLKRPGMHLAASMQAVAHGSNSVQYFQFRKGRGSSEKFHGAVVDHVGHGETRVFKDVTQVGERLEQLDKALYNSEVKPDVAIVFDTENRWAMERAQGPRNCGVHYAEAVRDQYRALWQMGVPVDIVDEECDISGYKLVLAPMLYMVRAGFEEKLKDFVKNGGTLVGGYHTGIVNENDLCYLGGWPGAGLRELYGVWNEEIDGLPDGEKNSIVATDGKTYEVSELCEIIHAEEAEVIGTYGSDFYQGQPAWTVAGYGQGKAYYVAARAGVDFYSDFLGTLVSGLGCKRALPEDAPFGVEACLRESGDTRFVFLQNYTGEPKTVDLPEGYIDLCTGEAVAKVELRGYDSVTVAKSIE